MQKDWCSRQSINFWDLYGSNCLFYSNLHTSKNIWYANAEWFLIISNYNKLAITIAIQQFLEQSSIATMQIYAYIITSKNVRCLNRSIQETEWILLYRIFISHIYNNWKHKRVTKNSKFLQKNLRSWQNIFFPAVNRDLWKTISTLLWFENYFYRKDKEFSIIIR